MPTLDIERVLPESQACANAGRQAFGGRMVR